MNARIRRKILKAIESTLYDGQLEWGRNNAGDLVTSRGGPDCEGYFYKSVRISRDGRILDEASSWRDCDGPGESASMVRVSGFPWRRDRDWQKSTKANRVYGTWYRTLRTERVSSSQRDHYAESMGY